MIRKFASLVLMFALICSLGISALATPSDLEPNATAAESSSPVTQPEATPNEKLNAEMRKLVADARAGKLAPAAKSQLQPAKRNNFSTKTKVAIGVAVAVVVVVALVVNHERKHFFD